jgi:hypothetical protein
VGIIMATKRPWTDMGGPGNMSLIIRLVKLCWVAVSVIDEISKLCRHFWPLARAFLAWCYPYPHELCCSGR